MRSDVAAPLAATLFEKNDVTFLFAQARCMRSHVAAPLAATLFKCNDLPFLFAQARCMRSDVAAPLAATLFKCNDVTFLFVETRCERSHVAAPLAATRCKRNDVVRRLAGSIRRESARLRDGMGGRFAPSVPPDDDRKDRTERETGPGSRGESAFPWPDAFFALVPALFYERGVR